MPSAFPELPWQKVGTDLFQWRQLIIVDYLSRYVEIARLNQPNADEVAGFQRGSCQTMAHNTHLKRMQTLLRPTSFHHVTSSPYYAQSNGEAERAVGTVKGLLKKNTDPYLALHVDTSTERVQSKRTSNVPKAPLHCA